MGVSLYQLSGHYIEALDFLTDPETDVPMQAINDTLEGLGGELEDKAVNVAKFLRNMEATAIAIKAAEESMAKRRKAFEARVNWLKGYIKANMEATGISVIECPYFKLSVAKNPAALDVFDEAAIPAEYKSIETVTVEHIDKVAIKAALAKGKAIPGARITNGTRLSIR
ncbi:siphovirus Gp157 family protein [Methylovulum psychrotolerans]|nr:siphovirus Gp157 family protein [Methylovulum psychrotolerans]